MSSRLGDEICFACNDTGLIRPEVKNEISQAPKPVWNTYGDDWHQLGTDTKGKKRDRVTAKRLQGQVCGSYRSEATGQLVSCPSESNVDWPCSSHSTDEVAEENKSKPYVLYFPAGGTTSLMQPNDTHFHAEMKHFFAKEEASQLMN